jgi:hypothetical protein
LTGEQRRRRSLDLARRSEQDAAGILTPAQAARLKQIALQVRVRAPDGFTAPEVVASLKLTAKQKQRIRGLQEYAQLALGEHLHDGFPPGPGGPRPHGLFRRLKHGTSVGRISPMG